MTPTTTTLSSSPPATTHPKVEKDPIIPTGWKVTMVFGFVIVAVLATLTILAAKGGITLSTRTFKILAGVTGTMGSAQVLLLPFLFAHYRSEKKLREQYEAAKSALTASTTPTTPPSIPTTTSTIPPSTTTPASTPSPAPSTTTTTPSTASTTPPPPTTPVTTSSPTPTITTPAPTTSPPGTITTAEWNELLKSAPKEDNGILVSYNLEDPNKHVAEPTTFHLLQLPYFGKYANGYDSFPVDATKMAVRLPKEHLKAFPNENNRRNKFFKDVENIECYFIVFDNTKVSSTAEKRNIAFHAMALPKYNPNNPKEISDQDGTVQVSRNNGIQTNMTISIFEPKGTRICPGDDTRIPEEGNEKNFDLELHPYKNMTRGLPMFSPEVASIMILKNDSAISSFYLCARFRGKGVAIHALVLNDNKTADGNKLETAIGKGNIAEFLKELDTKPFEKVQKTFLHPSNL